MKNNKPIPLNISLNENNNPNALLIYSLDNFSIETKGKLRGDFYLYGYSDVTLKANPGSLVKGAIHADGELIDFGVRVEYQKTQNMYKLIVCNTLPPMPNATKNNETLLGIDTNNNGIRDDVEIKILTYKPKICYFKPDSKDCKVSENPAFIAVSFQYARAYQTILKEFDGSKERAYELEKVIDKAIICDTYFYIKKSLKIPYKTIKSITYNNKLRQTIFNNYDSQLSGGVFSTVKHQKDYLKQCDFNVTEIEGEIE